MSGFSKEITGYKIVRDLADSSNANPWYAEINYYVRYVYETTPHASTKDFTNKDAKGTYFKTEEEAKAWLRENGVEL